MTRASRKARQQAERRFPVRVRIAVLPLRGLRYLRTVPLKVGTTYEIPRYFKTGYNPIQVSVLGRETVTLPGGGTAPALALEIVSRAIRMSVKLTDDARRLPVEMELPLPFGQVTLELTRAK